MRDCKTECNDYDKCDLAMFNACDARKPDKHIGKVTKQPSISTMYRWLDTGIARATDGCKVEPDGTCQHGKQSWLVKLGYC